MKASEIEAVVYRNPPHCVYTTGLRMSRFLKFTFVAAIVIFAWIEGVDLLVKNGLLPAEIYGFYPTFAIIVVFSAYLYNVWVSNHVRLTITPSGIEYRAVGYTVFTLWDNIERLGLEQTLGGEHEALILREPITPQVKWWKISAKPNMVSVIPLAEFGQWRYKPLGQDLRHYAPHLFAY